MLIPIISNQLAKHRARLEEASRSRPLPVIRSAESPMFEGLMRIEQLPGESEEQTAERRRKALASVIATAR